jgi:large subunit ribosomal protein L10
MAKQRKVKEELVQDIVSNINASKATVFANFQGLSVAAMEELRSACREANVACIASKKTLLKRALTEAGIEDVDTKAFDGAPAVFFGLDDEVAPAQIVAKFAKKHDVVTLFGGVLEGAYIDAAKVKELSALPSKDELLAKMVGSLNAPVSGFVNVLAGNIRGLVTVLGAIKDQKA